MKSISIKMKSATIGILVASTVGCLKTRTEVREGEQRQVLAQTVTSLQKENADSGSRLSEVNEQIRDLRGRVEVVENKVQSGQNSDDKDRRSLLEQNQELQRKIALIQETVIKMDTQMQGLNAEILALKAEGSGRAANSAAASVPKDAFEQGRDLFEQKEWKKAILSFQKYREANPKGKSIYEATYLIGVAFQELGMADEARTFYDEVISKAPKSNEAKKAKIRLKSLKK